MSDEKKETLGESQDARRKDETAEHHPAAEAQAEVKAEVAAEGAAAPAETKAAKPKAAKGKTAKKKEGEAKAAEAAAPASADDILSLDAPIAPAKVVKAKGSKNVTQGIAHVLA
ncbi:MAG: 30S ribosomal protein S11, partial [Chthoniobacterales bacterium]